MAAMAFTWFAAPFFGGGGQPLPPFDASDVLAWEFKPAAPRALFGQTTQSADSSQFQKVHVHAEDATGLPLTPAQVKAMGIEMAFVGTDGQQVGGWHAMTVSDSTVGGAQVECFLRVGLGGEPVNTLGLVDLPAGTYRRRVRVAATPNVVDDSLPQFVVQGVVG